ncbi:kinase-like domain-containing protein, partial [Tribonema minus]
AEFEIRTSDVRITGKLGEGNFGTVFRGRWQGQRVAVKRLKHAATRDLRHEVGALLRLRHPNVAFFYGATPPPDPLLGE